MRWVHLAVIVIFLAATGVFAAQNFQEVDVSFMQISIRMRLAFLIILIYLLGAATGGSLLALLRRSFEGARQRPGVS